MTITPTVLIAAQGMLSGQGVGINSAMTNAISVASGNPITGSISALQGQVALLASSDPTSSATLSSALGSLPSAFTNVTSTASAATTQAASMAPDPKTFISLHSASTAFGTASTEYSAALANFGTKSFGDLGIGVSNFTDANSGGLTSLLPGFGALANQTKTAAFGSLGSVLDPAALAKGQAQMASASLSDGLQNVGTGLKNYGTLVDFTNPQSLDRTGLYRSLRKQGLTDSLGIEDSIRAIGADSGSVTNDQLAVVFSGITGDRLQKIIQQTGAKPVNTPQNLNDLLDPSIMMPAGAVAAMGLKPGAGVAGLQSLGNTMTNIGVPMDNVSAAKLLGGVKTNMGSYMSQLTTLVPTSVSSALGPFLGSGSGPFGNPSMSDMMGSVAGKHTGDFAEAGKQITSIVTSGVGQTLSTTMTALMAAVTSGSGITTALAAFTAATTAFNAQAVGNSGLSTALSSINTSLTNVTDHISLENSNLTQAGISSLSGLSASNPPGAGQILSFASKLHSFGVDKMQLGHNDVFNGVATDDLYGDALKASLLEGKNVAAMASAGKPAPSISDTQAALSAANSSATDSMIATTDAAFSVYKAASAASDTAKKQFVDINTVYQANPNNDPDDGLQTKWKEAKQAALDSINAKLSAYQSFTQQRDKLIDMILTVSGDDIKKIQAKLDGYRANA